MSVCNNSVEKTKNNLIAIGLLTLVNGFLVKDLRPDSLANNFVSLTKYVWHNDAKARNHAIAAVLCKLGL